MGFKQRVRAFALGASLVLALGIVGCGEDGVPRQGGTTVASTRTRNAAPVCTGLGSRSEGWSVGGRLVKVTPCKDLAIECGTGGTKIEGWYSYTVKNKVKSDFTLVMYASCPR